MSDKALVPSVGQLWVTAPLLFNFSLPKSLSVDAGSSAVLSPASTILRKAVTWCISRLKAAPSKGSDNLCHCKRRTDGVI
jgi:hypothetical protein